MDGSTNPQSDHPPGTRPVGGAPPALYLAAAERLLQTPQRDRAHAARRFIASAPDMGIDLSFLVCSSERAGSRTHVRQCALAVPGAGDTLMLFVSGPGPIEHCGHTEAQHAERVESIRVCVERARERVGPGLAQGLAAPGETWAEQAFEDAGFLRVTELLYLSRPLPRRAHHGAIVQKGVVHPQEGSWPDGITVRALPAPGVSPGDLSLLCLALERSYEGTLDCPELTGLRTTEQIVQSHRAVGEWDPSLWWIVERDGRPEGCALFNHCPVQDCVELVYLGLSPCARGRGTGSLLLRAGIAAVSGLAGELRCAVDVRNAPARALYARAGFVTSSSRVAFVRPLRAR